MYQWRLSLQGIECYSMANVGSGEKIILLVMQIPILISRNYPYSTDTYDFFFIHVHLHINTQMHIYINNLTFLNQSRDSMKSF